MWKERKWGGSGRRGAENVEGMRDKSDVDQPGYLGAMLEEERRLVLIPLDPDRPWIAFRRMRSWMKRRKGRGAASVEMFTVPESGSDGAALASGEPVA